jgi:Domain of unknown function (DUF6089)
MKKLRLVLLITVISGVVSAQSKMALGFSAGTSWYMGDINPTKLFYDPSPALGAIFLYNFTKRWALRNQISYINLRSSYSPNPYYDTVPHFNASFMQVDSRLELNFAPFAMVDRKKAFSVYVNAGLGYTLPLGGTSRNMLTFPFAVGMKYGLTKMLGIGVEWMANKTFTDKLDNIESPGGTSLFHHNDWYTFFGLFIIYKIFDNPGDCPAYK